MHTENRKSWKDGGTAALVLLALSFDPFAALDANEREAQQPRAFDVLALADSQRAEREQAQPDASTLPRCPSVYWYRGQVWECKTDSECEREEARNLARDNWPADCADEEPQP